ncbi:MAG: hypothetical protein U0271_12360 [Polyangiaceae bacterium]
MREVLKCGRLGSSSGAGSSPNPLLAALCSRHAWASLAFGLSLGLTGCKDTEKGARAESESTAGGRSSGASASATEKDGAARTDSSPEGKPITVKQGAVTAGVIVKPDGRAWVIPTGADKPSGTLTVRPVPGGQSTEVPLKAQGDKLYADIPKLTSPLTELKVHLAGASKPLDATLVVPKGGTDALVGGADKAAKSSVKPGSKGPHGGLVQVVNDHILEVAGRKGSGEVRVYPLDANLKPTEVDDAKIELALVKDRTEVVDLVPSQDETYYHGDFALAADPASITVLVDDDDGPDCALVGYEPDEVLVVGVEAPVIALFIVPSFDVVVLKPAAPVVIVEDHHWKGKGKGKHKHH